MRSQCQFSSLNEVSSEKWAELSGASIYFGHQSVGNNIIEGLNEILSANSTIGLRIKETKEYKDIQKGVFAHSRVGKNTDPISKIHDFSSTITSGIGDTVNIAFFKFCYVDIHAGSKLDTIFKEYYTTMTNLKRAFPNTIFIHFTVPLRAEDYSPINYVTSTLKSFIGKNTAITHNIARNKFNEMLLHKYKGKEPVFDLALIESTHMNGTKEYFKYKGAYYESLAPEYSDDGGHLNEVGRKIIAEQLLIFIANIQ
ncbi:MAG: hypothetical protein JXB49_30135 [Bacteroidales bacterium]|nr:hypothetical protein [Bacteroidales bacterium]